MTNASPLSFWLSNVLPAHAVHFMSVHNVFKGCGCLRGVPLYVFPVQLLYNSAYSNLFSWLPFLMNEFLTATCPQRPSGQVSMNRSWIS